MKGSHFCGLKRFHFCLEDQGTHLLAYFDKKIIFLFGLLDLNHGLTPLENCNFWPYEKFSFSFLWSKKVSYLFRTSRNSIFKLF